MLIKKVVGAAKAAPTYLLIDKGSTKHYHKYVTQTKKRDGLKELAPLKSFKNEAGESDTLGYPDSSRLALFVSILLITIFTFGIYANTLKNGFVYDDKITIVDSPFIKDVNNIHYLFKKEYFELSGEITYRPIVTLTYLIDHSLYGLAPWGYHLTSSHPKIPNL